jgi:predicted transcriptional regulator
MMPDDEVLNLLRAHRATMTSQEVYAALQHRPWFTLVRVRGLLSRLKKKGLVDQMGSNRSRYDWKAL